MSRIQRALLLALGLLLFFSFPRPAVSEDPPGGRLTARQKKLLGAAGALCVIAHEQLDAPGANPADVPAKAAALGDDLGSVFAFVRDQIGFEPYRGSLRGAAGTLACRAGNALDKSRLLAALLSAKGRSCRLVQSTLPKEKAAALVRQFLAADPLAGALGAFRPGAPSSAPDMKTIWARAGLDATIIENDRARAARAASRAWDEAGAATTRHVETLEAELARSGVALGKSFEDAFQALTANVTAHEWIQVQTADGWTDLDPSFAGAKPGETPGGEAEPVAEDAIPRHTLGFQLCYRRTVGTDTKEEVILDVTLAADQAIDAPAAFAIHPVDAKLPPLDQAGSLSTDELVAIVKGWKRFQATLTVGDADYASRPFDLEGRLFDVSSSGGLMGGASGLGFGGLGGGGLGGEGDDDQGKFVDLSVLFELRSPGREPRKQRRVLLSAADLAGPHPKSVVLEWDVLLQPGIIAADLANYGSGQHLLSVYEPIFAAIAKLDAGASDFRAVTTSARATYSENLVALAQLRQQGLATLLAKNPKVTAFVEGPQLTVFENRLCLGELVGEPGCGCSKAFDIVENELAFVARESCGSLPAELALRQGVLDTLLEAMLLSTSNPAVRLASPTLELERARLEGRAIATWKANEAGPKATLSDPDRDWIRAYEKPDRIVIASARAEGVPGSTWWTVDPKTGAALGRGSGGRGQSIQEYLRLTDSQWEMVMCILTYGKAAVGAAVASNVSRVNQAVGQVGAFVVFGACLIKADPSMFALSKAAGSQYTGALNSVAEALTKAF
jgi:transglutaminase-like putative cysteine protease